jgi:hypothetical protein
VGAHHRPVRELDRSRPGLGRRPLAGRPPAPHPAGQRPPPRRLAALAAEPLAHQRRHPAALPSQGRAAAADAHRAQHAARRAEVARLAANRTADKDGNAARARDMLATALGRPLSRPAPGSSWSAASARTRVRPTWRRERGRHGWKAVDNAGTALSATGVGVVLFRRGPQHPYSEVRFS